MSSVQEDRPPIRMVDNRFPASPSQLSHGWRPFDYDENDPDSPERFDSSLKRARRSPGVLEGVLGCNENVPNLSERFDSSLKRARKSPGVSEGVLGSELRPQRDQARDLREDQASDLSGPRSPLASVASRKFTAMEEPAEGEPESQQLSQILLSPSSALSEKSSQNADGVLRLGLDGSFSPRQTLLDMHKTFVSLAIHRCLFPPP